MEKVKGTIMVDFVKTIKADKSGAYEPFLNEEDISQIADRILPSGWYPYDTFKKCFAAVASVLANNDMEAVRQWGRIYGENIVTNVYKNLIRQGDPMASLNKYGTYMRSLFNFGDIIVEEVSENEALVKMKDFDRNFEPVYHMSRGWIERSLELCGAAGINSEIVTKSWKGDDYTSFKFTWN